MTEPRPSSSTHALLCIGGTYLVLRIDEQSLARAVWRETNDRPSSAMSRHYRIAEINRRLGSKCANQRRP
jgi:hypothetical protein